MLTSLLTKKIKSVGFISQFQQNERKIQIYECTKKIQPSFSFTARIKVNSEFRAARTVKDLKQLRKWRY